MYCIVLHTARLTAYRVHLYNKPGLAVLLCAGLVAEQVLLLENIAVLCCIVHLYYKPGLAVLLCAGPVAEQVLLLENIATSIKTGPDQLPTVYNLLLEAVSVTKQSVGAAGAVTIAGPDQLPTVYNLLLEAVSKTK
jgi:hypothetical protein